MDGLPEDVLNIVFDYMVTFTCCPSKSLQYLRFIAKNNKYLKSVIEKLVILIFDNPRVALLIVG